MNQAEMKAAKFQVRTVDGAVVAASATQGGIDNFLDRFADGTGNAQYETLNVSKGCFGDRIYLVRELA